MPRKARRERYKLYLQSPHWRAFRRRYFQQHSKECRECKATERIDLHHLTYERIGGERLDDVVPLCRSCHKAAHAAQEATSPSRKRKRGRPKGFNKHRKRRTGKVTVTYADGTTEVKSPWEFQAKRKRPQRTAPVKKGHTLPRSGHTKT